jgi:hypothetical protein
MKISFNGWQRIGIVLSVMWLLGFALLSESNIRQVWFSYNVDISICDAKLREWKERSGGKEGPWTQYQLAEYEQCKDTALKYYGGVVGNMFAVDVGMIIVGWIVAWLGVVSFRWIRRGFG